MLVPLLNCCFCDEFYVTQKVGNRFSNTALCTQLSGPEFTSRANNENIDRVHAAGSFPNSALTTPNCQREGVKMCGKVFTLLVETQQNP